MLRVVHVNFHRDPADRPAAELLRDWPTLATVAQAIASAGAHISVLQAARRNEQYTRDGVDYHLLPIAGVSGAAPDTALLAGWLAREQPDVVHVHGLGFPRGVLALRAAAPGLPLVLQDHANRLPRLWQRPLWRRGLAAAQALAFCAREQAAPFVAARLLDTATPVFEIAESSNHFQTGDMGEARRATAMWGDPALLWVGRLDANKDPLTVLDGVVQAAQQLPGLHLYCCFGDAPLRARVQQQIDTDPRLRDRVQLLGQQPHARVETLMQAADYLLLGSHAEGCNYAVLEALACGLPPLVTDIPSMRRLTADGRAGGLWPVGDAPALARLLVDRARQPRAAQRAAARAHFEAALSPPALGRAWCAAYAGLAAAATRRAATAAAA